MNDQVDDLTNTRCLNWYPSADRVSGTYEEMMSSVAKVVRAFSESRPKLLTSCATTKCELLWGLRIVGTTEVPCERNSFPVKTDAPGGKLTMDVLLVEDDEVDELTVRRLLSNDVTIHCVNSLSQAIARSLQQQFHLILLDLGLPDSKGLETFTQLRAKVPEVPIVVLTGLDDESLAVKTIKEGAQDFLVKGYLDTRALQSLGFAVERNKLVRKLRDARDQQAKLESDLRDRERQLAHLGRVALLGEVTAEIAHEVSQPLQAIANVVSVLQIQSTSEAMTKLVQRIDSDLALAQAILKRTRKFSKNSDVELSSFAISEIVDETVRFVEFERSRVTAIIDLNLAEELLLVHADRVQILQVLVNLVRNALDALKELEPKARRMTIRTGVEHGMVFVEIEDQGAGLTVDAETVFAAFVTTKSDGLGMGLAICSRIMETHSGSISVRRASGRTVFKITLPQHVS